MNSQQFLGKPVYFGQVGNFGVVYQSVSNRRLKNIFARF